MEGYITDAEKVQNLYELHDKGYDNHYIAKALDTYESCVEAVLRMRHEWEREMGKQANCIHRYTEDGVSLCECDKAVCSGECMVTMEPEKRHIQIISERPPVAKVFVDGEEIKRVKSLKYEHEACDLATLEITVTNKFSCDDYGRVTIKHDKLEDTIEMLKNERECVDRDCDRDCLHCDLCRVKEDILDAFDYAINTLEELCNLKSIS